MKHWFLLVTTAAAFSAFTPAASQAQIAVEVPGVGVRIGEPPPPRRDRVWEEREVRRGGPDCRSVTVQEETPYGVRTVTRRQCD
jgi:hypothetical protein